MRAEGGAYLTGQEGVGRLRVQLRGQALQQEQQVRVHDARRVHVPRLRGRLPPPVQHRVRLLVQRAAQPPPRLLQHHQRLREALQPAGEGLPRGAGHGDGAAGLHFGAPLVVLDEVVHELRHLHGEADDVEDQGAGRPLVPPRVLLKREREQVLRGREGTGGKGEGRGWGRRGSPQRAGVCLGGVAHPTHTHTAEMTGVGGFSTSGGGGRYSPLARTSKQGLKRKMDGPPKNPTKTDPRAPEVTQTENSAKNENGIFGISTSRGFRNVAFAVYLVKKADHFQRSKKSEVNFGARVHNN